MVNHISVIAQGAPGSLARKLQENPTIGIAMFNTLAQVVHLRAMTSNMEPFSAEVEQQAWRQAESLVREIASNLEPTGEVLDKEMEHTLRHLSGPGGIVFTLCSVLVEGGSGKDCAAYQSIGLITYRDDMPSLSERDLIDYTIKLGNKMYEFEARQLFDIPDTHTYRW